MPPITFWRCSGILTLISFDTKKVKFVFGATQVKIPHVLMKCSETWQGKYFGAVSHKWCSYHITAILA